MTTKVKSAKKVTAKKEVVKVNKVKLTPEAKQAKFEASDYFQRVILPNRKFKEELKSLNNCIRVSLLVIGDDLPPFAKRVLKASLKNRELYHFLESNVRQAQNRLKMKTGYRVFYLLQSINKHAETIQGGFFVK